MYTRTCTHIPRTCHRTHAFGTPTHLAHAHAHAHAHDTTAPGAGRGWPRRHLGGGDDDGRGVRGAVRAAAQRAAAAGRGGEGGGRGTDPGRCAARTQHGGCFRVLSVLLRYTVDWCCPISIDLRLRFVGYLLHAAFFALDSLQEDYVSPTLEELYTATMDIKVEIKKKKKILRRSSVSLEGELHSECVHTAPCLHGCLRK